MCVLLTMNYHHFLHSCSFGKQSHDRFGHYEVLEKFNIIHSMHFDCSKLYIPTSAHTACRILQVICTYQPSYMFHWVSTFFRETLSQGNLYEGWNFNFGNTAVTFDTANLQSSYFHRPSMYSPKLCRTHSQRWGSCMMPLAAPVLLMVQTERSEAEGLNPPCNCPIR